MKRFVSLLILVLLLVPFGLSAQPAKMIKTKVPKRPAGQQDVLQLTAPPLETVRVGFIGLGMRGPDAVERFSQIEGTDIKGLCDVEADRVEECQKLLEKLGRPRAVGYSGSTEAYKAMWCCLGPLTRISLENGSAPVAVPDFTRGAWNRVQGFRYAFK